MKIKYWIILTAYVALIYSTLSVAPGFFKLLSGLLGKNLNLAVNIFVISALITAAGLFFLYGRIKTPGPGLYLKVGAIFLLYLLLIFRWTEIPAEKLHLLEYGFLGYFALKVVSGVQPRMKQYLYTALIVGAIGCGDELIQKLLPNRVCDPKDMALNFISGILGLALVEVLRNREAAG